jgi:hypothetical protein
MLISIARTNAQNAVIPRHAACRGLSLFVAADRRGIPRFARNDHGRYLFLLLTNRCFRVLFCLALAACSLLLAGGARGSELDIPADAKEAIRLGYSGKPEAAVALAHKLEAARPDHPLGYLIEADLLWWNIYCKRSERKYNTIDAWGQPRPADADDDAEIALSDKVTRLAEASIAKLDTAEMELYAGLGYASRARLLGLRFEKMPVARAGVAARKHLLRCLELDPEMADADLGLGLYNYYVDTLSGMAKVLRFFMGIPGGDKRVGLRQLEIASSKGELTQVEARFNMAKNLRNYDLEFARALAAASPPTAEFPENPVFQLVVGDIDAKLGHDDEAAMRFRAAAAAPPQDAACAMRVQQLARESLDALASKQKDHNPQK